MKNNLPIDTNTTERMKFFTKALSVIMSADRRADSIPMEEWNNRFGKAEMLIGEPCEFVKKLLQTRDFTSLEKAAKIAHIDPEYMITFCNLFACEMSELGEKTQEYKNNPTIANRLHMVNQNQLVTLLAASVLGNFEFSANPNSLHIGDVIAPIAELHKSHHEVQNPQQFLLEKYDDIWQQQFKMQANFSQAAKYGNKPTLTIAQMEDDILDWIQDGAKEVFSDGKYISPNAMLLFMEKKEIDWQQSIRDLYEKHKGRDVKIKYADLDEDIKNVIKQLYKGDKLEQTAYRTKFPQAFCDSEINNPHHESPLVQGLDCLARVSDVQLIGKIAAVYLDNRHTKW